LALAVLFVIEAAGGLVLFAARLISGRAPGETLHIVAGALLAGIYAVYQVRHWARVRSLRWRLDHTLGLIAAGFMLVTLGSGLLLAGSWWEAKVGMSGGGEVVYAPSWSAVHNVGSLLVLTFLGAHVAAVLFRDR
jgi:hypothetical protein